MIVHVDGDVVVYRAGYAAEHNLYHLHYVEEGEEKIQTFDGAKELKSFMEGRTFGDVGYWIENETQIEPEEAALYNVRSILKSIADELKVDLEEEVKVYLSGEHNYRLGIATLKPYKGNRDPTKKPVHAAAIKDLMRSRFGASTSNGQEADDDIAQAHYSMWLEDPDSTVIATIDKDLNNVPGLHYNFATKSTYYVTPQDAMRNFWTQMLTGDTVDNIPGIPGIGPKKAEKLLSNTSDELCMYKIVQEEYIKHYKDKADEALLEMGRLLFIRHGGVDWWNIPELGDDNKNNNTEGAHAPLDPGVGEEATHAAA